MVPTRERPVGDWLSEYCVNNQSPTSNNHLTAGFPWSPNDRNGCQRVRAGKSPNKVFDAASAAIDNITKLQFKITRKHFDTENWEEFVGMLGKQRKSSITIIKKKSNIYE